MLGETVVVGSSSVVDGRGVGMGRGFLVSGLSNTSWEFMT